MKQRGFTLIELIIVIVILGILAVTAAPRFLDLGDNARSSAMQGILGAVKSASQIAHAALLVNPDEEAIEGVDIQDLSASPQVTDVQNYPHAEDICDLIGLTTVDGDAGALGTDDASDSITCTLDGTNAVNIRDTSATTAASCQVRYVEPTGANLPPSITSVITGC